MDPAYDRTLIDRLGARCPVHIGTWHASIYRDEWIEEGHNWGVRTWNFTVKHEHVATTQLNFTSIKEIAVDTATVVVCDDPIWRSDRIAEETPDIRTLKLLTATLFHS